VRKFLTTQARKLARDRLTGLTASMTEERRPWRPGGKQEASSKSRFKPQSPKPDDPHGSRDTLLHNFRTGEILPPARTNEQELKLIKKVPPPVNVMPMVRPTVEGAV